MGQGDIVYSGGPGSVSNPISLAPVPSPSTPTSGINLGDRLYAGRPIPYWVDPTGQIWPVQEALWPLTYWMSHPTQGTAVPNQIGPATATADASTLQTTTPAVTSKYTRTPKTVYTSAAAAVNRGAGWVPASLGTNAVWYRGDAAGLGGFFFYCRFGIQTYSGLGGRMFVGLAGSTTSPNAMYTANPSANAGDYIGLGQDAADAAVSLMTRDNVTTTKTTITGMPAPASTGAFFVDFYLYAKPNDTAIYYRVDDLVAGTTVVDTSISTTLPRNTIFMAPMAILGTGSTSVACAVALAKGYMIGQQN